MKTRRQVAKYIVADLSSALLAWVAFYYFRKTNIEFATFTTNTSFYLGLVLVPLYWLILYATTGNYKRIYRKYRMRETGQTLLISIIGCLGLFFALILDDSIHQYKDYYVSLSALFCLHFIFTIIPRLVLTSNTVKKVHRGVIGFPTLIIGGNQKALGIYQEILELKNSPGYKFKGFVSINGTDRELLQSPLTYFGDYSKTHEVIKSEKIEEVIIALESSEHEELKRILNDLSEHNVAVKVIPDMFDILSGTVKMTAIFGALLIEVNNNIMPEWQQSVKRFLDIFCSTFALILLSPIFFILALLIVLGSKGPVFFIQERIGLGGKPFKIYKFRSMVSNAEENGPQLSSTNDSRITTVGKFMRKSRMDEIPQFINVLKGDMSLVGPRPERQYFIDQITQRAPHYKHLHKVRPGITSWGQVKYGYAENVDQMVSRLKYDILYIENMSLALDFKILIYTVLIVLKGTGK